MNLAWQLPAHALMWMFIALITVLLAHVLRLPLWLLMIYALCIFWRYKIFYAQWRLPSIAEKLLFIILSLSGIYSTYRSFVGLEPALLLLMLGYAFKFLEAKNKRDYILFIYLGFFSLVTVFLFDQRVFISLYALFSLVLLSAALISLHRSESSLFSLVLFKKSLGIFAQALPFALVLFIVFPRLEPFWRIQLPSHHAKTGMGETMSPGDISQLSKDSSLAFRVNFEQTIPARSELYWRGLVMSYFNGRAWHQGTYTKFSSGSANLTSTSPNTAANYRYTIIQEPSYRPWLYGLAVAASQSVGVMSTSDYRLQYRDDVYERMAYELSSDINKPMAIELSATQFRKETLLNANNNQQSRDFAKNLFNDSLSVKAYIDAVLAYYANQGFVYSLSPPALGEHAVDEFLFASRVGFCEHYASSFVFLMRAAGIPARVVAGYQGGEINPLTGSVLVHQFDAHAWAEVWVEHEGWVRYDPTLQVAPSRVDQSVQDLAQTYNDFLAGANLSAVKYKHIALLNMLRLRLDALEYHWAKTVLQYKGERQLAFISRLLGEVSFLRIMLFFMVVCAPAVLWLVVDFLRKRPSKTMSSEMRVYQDLCDLLLGYGFVRNKDEGAIDFAKRVDAIETDLPKAAKLHFLAATRLFVALKYESQTKENRLLLQQQLQAMVKLFSRTLAKQAGLANNSANS